MGLLDKPCTGRPSTVDETVQTAIEKDMKKTPSDFGYLAAFWTVGLLCIHLMKTLSVKVSNSTVRRCLHTLGYAFNRPRISPDSNDPEASVKLHDMAYAMVNAPKNAVFLCEDESTFRLLPVIRSMWMKVGQQLRIVVPSGWNQWLEQVFPHLRRIECPHRRMALCHIRQSLQWSIHLLS